MNLLTFIGIFFLAAAFSKAFGNPVGWAILIGFGVAVVSALIWDWWVGRPPFGGWFNKLINKLARTNCINKDQEKFDKAYCREQGIEYEEPTYDEPH